MATRLKTIEYVFPMSTASTAEGTSYLDSADLTIYIPETTGRTFKSCYLDVMFHDNQATAGDDVAGISLRASCDAGTTWTTRTRTVSMADTGENIGFRVFADITAEFTARFSGTSDTLRYGWYVDYATATNSPVITNVSCKAVITYEWTDTDIDTRIKTVRVPLQGNADTGTTSLTTTLADLGGVADQIPALDTFLPESTKTYRAIFLEFFTTVNPIAHTTDTAFECKVGALTADTGATVEMGQVPEGLQIRHTYDCLAASMPTNAVQNVQVRSTAAADTFGTVAAILTVTYEYSHTNSTTILNSLVLGSALPQLAGNSELYAPLIFKLDVAEPGTITLVQSGMVWHQTRSSGSAVATGWTILTAGQSGSNYYLNKYVSTVNYGTNCSHSISHRSDLASGTWALAAGMNTLAGRCAALGGASVYQLGYYAPLAYINYTSGKASGGDGSHNHTTLLLHKDLTISSYTAETRKLIVVPESNPTLQQLLCIGGAQSNGSWVTRPVTMRTSGSELGLPLVCDIPASEQQYSSSATTATPWPFENGWQYRYDTLIPWPFCRGTTNTSRVARFTSDLAAPGFLDPYLSRTLSMYYLASSAYQFLLLAQTYHDITYTVSGTVSGYTGDGSGLTVEIWNKDEDWLEATATTSAGGTYTATVRTRDTCYAVVRQDSTHVGRSDDGTGT